jgi:GT2 family glycosyltransferase
MSPPKVWAIVLTHGGAEEITAACLESLLAQDYAALTTLLVDNASYDGSGARLRDRYPGVAYLNTGGNFGYTGGNNRGAAHALAQGAEHLVVLNNDTVLEPDCIRLLVEAAGTSASVGLVAPKILFFDEPSRIWYGGGDVHRVRATARHRHELEEDDRASSAALESITFATGCCFLIPADVMRRLGLFAEDFFIYCEDLELSMRVRQAGLEILYQPAARLYHREPVSRPNPNPFQIRMRDRNRRRIARRRYRPWERMRFALWFYPTRLVHLVRYAVRGDAARAWAILRGAVEA